MPPKPSSMFKPLSDDVVEARFFGTEIGAEVTVVWRDEGSEEWTAWDGQYRGTINKDTRSFALLAWTSQDPIVSGLLPNPDIEVAEITIKADDGTRQRTRNVDYMTKYRTHAHLQKTIQESQAMNDTTLALRSMQMVLDVIRRDMEDVRTRLYRLEDRTPMGSVDSELSSPRRPQPRALDLSLLDFEVDPTRTEEATPLNVEDCGIGVECEGCETFACVLFHEKADRLAFIDAVRASSDHDKIGEKDGTRSRRNKDRRLARWVVAHQLVLQDEHHCSEHPTKKPTPTCMSTGLHLQCTDRDCRLKKTPLHQPGSWKNFILFLVEHVAAGTNLPTAHLNMKDCSRDKTRRWEEMVAEAATLFFATAVEDRANDASLCWHHMEWDETFHAARTFQRGSRVRQGGALTYHGGVHVIKTSDGRKKVIDTIIAAAATKSRADLFPLMMDTAAPGALIETDGARTYRGLEDCGFTHKWVNHSKEFVAADGTHTNSVEGLWKQIKTTAKGLWGRQPRDAEKVALNFQLANFIVNSKVKKVDVFCGLLILVRWHTAMHSKPADAEKYEALVKAAVELLASHEPRDADIDREGDDAPTQAAEAHAAEALPTDELALPTEDLLLSLATLDD
jgi:hypothetical protein